MDKFERFALIVALLLIGFSGCVSEVKAADEVPVYRVGRCSAIGGGFTYTSEPEPTARDISEQCFSAKYPSFNIVSFTTSSAECVGGISGTFGVCSRFDYRFAVQYSFENPSTGETQFGNLTEERTATVFGVCPAGTIPDPEQGSNCIDRCSEEAGMSPQMGLVSSSGSSSTCWGQCQYNRDPGPSVCLEGDMCMSVFSLSGQECGAEEPDAPEGDCISDGGTMFCTDDLTGDENCGEINGSGVCLGDIPDGKCTFLSGGGMVCDADAPNQPTTGDGVTPAAPDATGTTAAGDPWNYYGDDTIGDSGTPIFGDGPPDSWGDGSGGQDDDGGTCDPSTEECGDEEGSVSGGDFCDVPPSCEGDPLQCAIINQSWLERCADFDSSDAEILDAAGLDPVSAGDFAVGNDVDVSSMLDDSGYGWSRSCFPDKVVVVPAFGEVVIPFSELCWLFQLIGSIVVMAAAYTSYRIVLGSEK